MLAVLRRVLRAAFHVFVALFLIFEEWGWEPLARLVAKLARLPFFAWLENRIKVLPPWAALATFAIPALSLLPVKLLAVYLIGQGHTFMGLVVLLAAKVVGTALLARLFTLTQPALMQLSWFARWYPRWKGWKDGVIAQVKSSSVWRAGIDAKERAVAKWGDFMKGFSAGD